MLPLRSASQDDDVIWHGNYVMISKQPPSWICHLGSTILDPLSWILDFLLREEITKVDSTIIKSNERSYNVAVTATKYFDQ